jgi:hypothetical protein
MTNELENLMEIEVSEFQKNINFFLKKVETGESFIIRNGNQKSLIVPFKETIKFAMDSLNSSADDEIVRLHREHEEGS